MIVHSTILNQRKKAVELAEIIKKKKNIPIFMIQLQHSRLKCLVLIQTQLSLSFKMTFADA